MAPFHRQLAERLRGEGMYDTSEQPAWSSVERIGYAVKLDPPLADGWKPAPGWAEPTRTMLEELELGDSQSTRPRTGLQSKSGRHRT